MTNKRILIRTSFCANNLRRSIFLMSIAFAWAGGITTPTVGHATPQDSTASQMASRDAITQRLIAEEKMSWDLAIKRDAAAYKALHAPDFITVGGKGVMDKTSSETSALDSDVRFDQCDLSGFDARFVAENAVLITYHVKAAGLDHGKPFQLDSYASSLWMNRDGKWLNVFYQSTPTSAK